MDDDKSGKLRRQPESYGAIDNQRQHVVRFQFTTSAQSTKQKWKMNK